MEEKPKQYRLEKTVFQAMTFEEADHYTRYFKDVSWQEKLAISFFLTGMAYKFDLNDPPKMDKTVFSLKKQDA